jgi:hypothetical protein
MIIPEKKNTISHRGLREHREGNTTIMENTKRGLPCPSDSAAQLHYWDKC